METFSFQHLTYSPPDVRQPFVADDYLEQHCPLDYGRHGAQTSLTAGLGFFESLPPEILFEILGNLDIQSLLVFRRINHYANRLADAMHQFKAVICHSPNLIRGILKIEAAARFTMLDLYDKLCQHACDRCGLLAQYIWLITCCRLCLNCTSSGFPDNVSTYEAWDADKVFERTGLEPQHLPQIPSFRCPPSVFESRRGVIKFLRHEVILYDAMEAVRLGIAVHGSKPAMHQASRKKKIVRVRPCALKANHTRPGTYIQEVFTPPYGVCGDMVTVLAPWLNKAAQKADRGFHCSICLHTDRQNRIYTQDTFLDHLKDCRVQPFSFWDLMRGPLPINIVRSRRVRPYPQNMPTQIQ